MLSLDFYLFQFLSRDHLQYVGESGISFGVSISSGTMKTSVK